MRILAIETATEACSVALFEHGQLLDRRHEVLGRGHAERLVPMIADLPDKGRADDIRVSLGPGSFTGVRIGIAVARALGIAWGAQVRGYPTLALVARQAAGDSELLVCMNGGHGEWFVQPFDTFSKPLGEHASLPPKAAAAKFAIDRVVGSRAEEFVALRGWGIGLGSLPDASQAALLDDTQLSTTLAPIYGRPPDAKLPGQ